MSAITTKATPTTWQADYAKIDSQQKAKEAEIDAKKDITPDQKRSIKSALGGIFDRIRTDFLVLTVGLPYDRLSQAEVEKRFTHSSSEVDRKMGSLMLEAEKAAAREPERKASGERLASKVASLERPGRSMQGAGAASSTYSDGASAAGSVTPTIRIVAKEQASGTITPGDPHLQVSSARVVRKGDEIVADVRGALGDVRLVKDFSLCQEIPGGRCETVSLPKEIRRNIVSFLQDVDKHHREWNCSDFVKGAHGHPYKHQHFDFGEWDARPLSTSRAVSGDVVQIGSNSNIHFAIYLRDDLYLSKLGDKGGFVISSLEEMTRAYQSDKVVLLRPKT
ncbi:MAG: hypothetical protein NTX49_10145 [Chlamydiae bacterium]|nr:hypothetical protein [Chlamydiota bacterium]